MDWYLKGVGSKVGVSKRLLSRYPYEQTIGRHPEEQGENWLIPTEDIILAKDYVASLTDTGAVNEHRRHCLEVG